MRPRFVTAVLSLTALLFAALFWLKRGPARTSATPPSGEIASQTISLRPNSTPAEAGTLAPTVTDKRAPGRERSGIEAEIDRLTQLSMKGEPASLPEILGALTHPDREVREAAIEATMQVGDSNAIPVLKQASEMVNDLEDKMAFLE